MITLLFIICWIVLCVLTGTHAQRKYQRSAAGWGWLAVFISPLLAWIILWLVGPKPVTTTATTTTPNQRVVDWSRVDWTGQKQNNSK
jgi:hypothetical protein